MRPLIAVVGRPNVGKSTLVNRLAGRKVAIVEDEPGVTRDRLFVDCRLANREVVLIDTGGLDPTPDDELSQAAVSQAHLAVQEADLILFLCDGKSGVHPVDHLVADVLRKSGKPFICLINKMDPGSTRQELEFHELGLDFIPISSSHGSGLSRMAEQLDEILTGEGFAEVEPDTGSEEFFSTSPEHEDSPKRLSICLVGRPNVGKSSLANRLLGESRQMVSTIAGTTRDAVDLPFSLRGKEYLLVDTPGVRRKGRISEKLERYSVVAAFRSMQRAHVSIVVLDASEPFADQDARLLRLVHDRGRPLVVVVNKTDLLDSEQRKKYDDLLKYGMRFVSYAPVVYLSALTGKGIGKLLPKVQLAWKNSGVRLGTGELNRLVEQALQRQQPPVIKGRRGKIYYITQAGVHPPTFIAWVNDPSRFPVSYRRYLDHQFRERFSFKGTALKLILKSRNKDKKNKKKRRKRK